MGADLKNGPLLSFSYSSVADGNVDGRNEKEGKEQERKGETQTRFLLLLKFPSSSSFLNNSLSILLPSDSLGSSCGP